MELNKDAILEELTNFEKNYSEIDEIPEILEKYLTSVAHSGDIIYSWSKFKPLIKKKIELISTEFNENHPYDVKTNIANMDPFNFEEIKKIVLTEIDSFTGAPFTIQRLCELLTCPYKHYKRTDKFMRGLEKNVMVVSTVEPLIKTNDNITQKSGIFIQPSTSETTRPSSSSINGFKDFLNDSQKKLNHDKLEINLVSSHNIPSAPLHQLDSFTTVFVSSSSTPLEVVSDMRIYEPESSLSSKTNSSDTLNSSQKTLPKTNNDNNSVKDELSLEKNCDEIVNNINKIYEEQKTSKKSDLVKIEKNVIDDLEPNNISLVKDINNLENNENLENQDSAIKKVDDVSQNITKNKLESNQTSDVYKRECESPEFCPKRFKWSNIEITDNLNNNNEENNIEEKKKNDKSNGLPNENVEIDNNEFINIKNNDTDLNKNEGNNELCKEEDTKLIEKEENVEVENKVEVNNDKKIVEESESKNDEIKNKDELSDNQVEELDGPKENVDSNN